MLISMVSFQRNLKISKVAEFMFFLMQFMFYRLWAHSYNQCIGNLEQLMINVVWIWTEVCYELENVKRRR